MKIICIEEHASDPAINRAVQPLILDKAPYLVYQTSGMAISEPRSAVKPSRIRIADAIPMGLDLGQGRVGHMDTHGITVHVVSQIAMVQQLPAQQAVDLSRAANDRLAKAVAERPDRLAGFAVLPWQDALAAADELSRAVGELGMKGALITGKPGDKFLDHPRYFPVLARFAELGVPLYIHPFYPDPRVTEAYYEGLPPLLSAELALGAYGWHYEAGLHVLRLILAGVFDRLPGLQVISGHWGEMVPFYLDRLDFVLTRDITGLARTVSDTYREHVHVTPSGMFDLAQFEFIHKVLGVDRIIWSTDYPYLTADGVEQFLMSLPVSDADREKIASGNAERLLRL